jgi:hypothetical protein
MEIKATLDENIDTINQPIKIESSKQGGDWNAAYNSVPNLKKTIDKR